MGIERKRYIVMALGIWLVLLAGCSKKEPEPQSQSFLLLGTVTRISIYDNPSDEAFDAAFARIRQIEDEMTLHAEGSELQQVNAAAGTSSVSVSEDTYAVVSEALKIADLSDGAFDPTIGALVEAWDIGGDHPRKPSDEEIAALLPEIGYDRVLLDPASRSVGLADKGMVLDLGGIAKGYAADEVAKVLAAHDVESAIINLGGNVLVMGKRPDGQPWRIGIQNPDRDRGDYVMVLSLEDQSLVTSGPYERYFELDGKLYHHILDTKTGYPVDSPLSSVSIVSGKSFVADALSTAVYALGADRGMALVESLDDVEAIFFTKDKQILLSSGMARIPYALSDTDYTIQR